MSSNQRQVSQSVFNSLLNPRGKVGSWHIPMSLGVAILWLFFRGGLVLWWALMSALFRQRAYAAAVLTAFAMPTLYMLGAFIGSVIFMPLFIYLAAMLSNIPHNPSLEKVYLFPIGMLGFRLSAAWLSLRAVEGSHVPGLEIRPPLPFHPDFILPGGVLFVKGAIIIGVGLMIAIMPRLGMPQWNWWGFVFAFWGIITLIPLRGMYKIVKSRRLRLLGLGGTGFGHELVKELILLYGFVNAFFGTVPFVKLGVLPEFNTFGSGTPARQATGIAALTLAFIVLVPWRGWYKTRLPEGMETNWQLFVKQVLLWLGSMIFVVGSILILDAAPALKNPLLGDAK